jgi:hypothetical protein
MFSKVLLIAFLEHKPLLFDEATLNSVCYSYLWEGEFFA